MYTKLHSSIIHSTIWDEAAHVRLVWITMLALADRDGVVGAAVPGLARAARVTVPEAEEALERLMAPDPYSRTPDHEGRRIEPVTGGWRLLNYETYREKASTEEQREKAAARQRRKRERDASRQKRDMSRSERDTVTEKRDASRQVTPVTKSNDIAEAKAEADTDSESRARVRVASDVPRNASSLSGLRDPLNPGDTVSSEEYPWRAFRAEAAKHGVIVPPHPSPNDRRHCMAIEQAALHAAAVANVRTGRAVEDAYWRLVTLAMRRYAERRAERPDRHPWKLGFVASAWAELTAGAIPQEAA